MPTYEYRCKDCGHELEAVQAFSDDPLTECPSCAGTLKKKFGAVGISFKGGGFYKTDSRPGSSSSSSAAATSGSSSSEAASGDSSSSSSGSGAGAGTKESGGSTTPAATPAPKAPAASSASN